MHINGPYDRFPLRETRDLEPPEATSGDYRRLAEITGIERCVVVQPSYFAKDNSCTLTSLTEIGLDARAVVVIDPDCPTSDLQRFHDLGARGVRLQTVIAGGTDPRAAQALAARLAPLGWHIQLFVREDQIPDLLPMINDLPVPVVFDHMAHLDRNAGEDSENFALLLRLLERGNCWIKLSNCFFNPSGSRARRLIEANPERVVWGSDWPHVAITDGAPDDGRLLDQLADWASNEDTLRKILCDNPTALYFGR